MHRINHGSRSQWPFAVGALRRGRAARHHAGVSVVEVLFAIGITVVGLLGVLTILPVAGNRHSQGLITDVADRVGRNAIREFDLRYFRQPNMLAQFNSASLPLSPPSSAIADKPRNAPYAFVNYKPYYGQSFCIDPLFVATYITNYRQQLELVPQEVQWFPYTSGATHKMRRLTLRYSPGQTIASGGGVPAPPANFSWCPTMNLAQAAYVFMPRDDLIFDMPDDRTLPPVQAFFESGSTTTTANKRDADGNFTWMATVTPLEWPDERNSSNVPFLSGTESDLYLLSIIVFHRRDMSMVMDNGSADEPDNERVVNVAEFYGLGYGGGDVRLETIARGNPVRHHAKDLTLRAGDWLMLSAKTYNDDATPRELGTAFRWYRVASVDQIDDNSTPYSRNVMLQGRDWTQKEWFQLNANRQRTTLPRTTNVTRATLLKNVVAVYEKTVRLETSSLWTMR